MSSALPAGVPLADLYAHPVTAALLNEALALLGDGNAAASVEAAAVEAGMVAGPLALLDAMSLEVVDHALHAELHALEHGHGDGHGHSHGHDHGHDHAPAHGHDQAQAPHAHDHSHGHARDHSHDHVHSHDHSHGHEHDHAHGHEHTHGHDHAHEHTHPHGPAPAPAANPAADRHRHQHAAKSRRMPESAVYVLEKMAHGYKRLGRAAGAGFYDYGSQPPALWSGLKTFERRSRQLAPELVGARLLDAATLAALRVAPGHLDPGLAAALGPSVPLDAAQARARIAQIGAQAFAARCRALAGRFGPRFEPPGDLASNG
jgi:hypothetical protein